MRKGLAYCISAVVGFVVLLALAETILPELPVNLRGSDEQRQGESR